jgi:hypothetical protein
MDEIRGHLLYAECEILNPKGSGLEASEQAKKAADMARKAEAPVELVHALSLQARANYKAMDYSSAIILSSQATSITVVQPVPGQNCNYYHGKICSGMRGLKSLARLFLTKARTKSCERLN